jgi:hypothetical protein
MYVGRYIVNLDGRGPGRIATSGLEWTILSNDSASQGRSYVPVPLVKFKSVSNDKRVPFWGRFGPAR